MKVLLALLVALSGPAFARLGETQDQVFQRYGGGTPMEISTQGIEGFRYRAGTIEVAILFHNGQSVMERYDGANNEKELMALLKSLSDGKPWTPGQRRDDGSEIRWFGKLKAYILKGGGVIITTDANLAALEKVAAPADLEVFPTKPVKPVKPGKAGK